MRNRCKSRSLGFRAISLDVVPIGRNRSSDKVRYDNKIDGFSLVGLAVRQKWSQNVELGVDVSRSAGDRHWLGKMFSNLEWWRDSLS